MSGNTSPQVGENNGRSRPNGKDAKKNKPEEVHFFYERAPPRRKKKDDYEPEFHVQLKSTAYGDPRPYVKTNLGTAPGLLQEDEVDPHVFWWCGKRLYLQRGTQERRFLKLLADNPGRWHPLDEIYQVVYGMRSDRSIVSDEEARKANQRLRKCVSRVEDKLEEWGLDDHVTIVAKRHKFRGPGYVLLLLQDQKYEEGEHPVWPSSDIDDEDLPPPSDLPILLTCQPHEATANSV
jgi:hypothetical protein